MAPNKRDPGSNTKPRLTSSERTREALIRAGLALFGQKGFDATSTREIAAAAGANIGSIAYHFGGKEGLRTACAQYIVDTMSQMARLAFGGIVAQEGGRIPPEEARAMLMRGLEGMVGFVVARPEAGEIVQFLLRELTHPTEALDIIYAGVFEPVHRRLCQLWEAATGEPADSERTRITVFTLIGQVVYFRIARQPVMRRMGWQEIGQREAAAVTSVAADNLGAILQSRKRTS